MDFSGGAILGSTLCTEGPVRVGKIRGGCQEEPLSIVSRMF